MVCDYSGNETEKRHISFLLNLILEAVMRLAVQNHSLEEIRGYGEIINNLRFADDIDLIADTEEHLQQLTTAVHN